MAIEVICTCGKRLRAKEEFAGRRARCPECGQTVLVPSPRAEKAPGLEEQAKPLPARPPQPHPPAEAAEDRPLEDTYGLAAEPPREAPTPRATRALAESRAPRPEEDAPEDDSERPARRKRRARPATAEGQPPSGGVATIREYMYVVLVLALIPLAVTMLQGNDVAERLERTLRANPQTLERFKDRADASVDDVLGALPGRRIEGAHLPRGSWGHWLYAVAAAVFFFGIVLTMFHASAARPQDVLLVGLITATVGILFLLAVQFIALWTHGRWFVGRSIVVIVFYVLKFIGFSYRSALDEDSNFLLSMLGFTMGVGLCEELVKALPLLWHFRRTATLGWRGACLWGLATGVGFGVSEGITYSSDFYNGIHTGGTYVVRFISCVALHAIWSASVGITIWKCQELIQGNCEWYEFFVPVFRVLAVAMVLHGLYDTLLKKDMSALALVVAVGSFGWLVVQIELARRQERVELAGTG